MTSTNSCPHCGATLPADAPAGLCPACLMNAGVPSQVDPGATVLIEKPKPRDLPLVGETFGAYRIERELGHGGMGAVFAAEQLESGRRVALKVLSRQLDSPEARARFLREGRLAASINHPNSVYVFGTEEVEGTPVIAMELIAGGTLQERVQRSGPLPVGEAVDAVLQIIAGLEAAQAIGILHRDIKPANCFEDSDGTVKVGDFGLSISTHGRGESHLTLPGDFLGTPAFCPPEQLRGDELNVRSDMYSVGVTLFYLLTGRTPFEGKNMVQLLANALEKSAPSPSQFRPEIPQSLSRVVLRCLEKLPTSRFGSYEELRRALQPFTSTAPTPATLGLRFVAMVADSAVLAIMNWTVMAICVRDLSKLADPARYQQSEWVGMAIGLSVMQLLYWSILEGVWGASVGKLMVGLRVARLNRSAPGIPRAMARYLIVNAAAFLTYAFTYGSAAIYDPSSPAIQIQAFIIMGVGIAYHLGLFATARRRNGFAAVHDLLTGTRVIQKAAYQPRAVMTQVEAPVATTEAMPKLGPYHVLTQLSTGAEETFSLGYDTRLLRKVWLRQTPAGEPAVPPVLRNIARPTRLRWLQGERNADGSWDAYEAVSGAPLVNLLSERQPWQKVRHWLTDLAAELEASAKDDGASLAMPLLDRVWITSDGRAKLLDFTAPGAVRTNAAARTSASSNIFLNQVATSALEGRIAGAEESTSRIAAAPLPVGARAALRDLIVPSPPINVTAKLKPLLQASPRVARWKRVVMVVICAVPALMMGSIFTLGAFMYHQWQTEQPELVPLMSCLHAHQDLKEGKSSAPLPDSHPNAAEQQAAMEIHIAGRYGPFIRDEKAWSSRMVKLAIQPPLRAEAERMVAAHPHPTPEEIKKADAVVKPLIESLENPTSKRKTDAEIITMMAALGTYLINMALTWLAVLSLLLTLILRRGLLFRILGIALVTREGADASRLRMLARGFIAWSPVLLVAMLMKFYDPVRFGAFLPLHLVLTGVVLVIVIVSLIPRERGLQDMLAGTWLVPA